MDTKTGHLPPWALAMVAAYDQVISDVEAHTGMTTVELLGFSKKAYIASKVELKGGGRPSARAL